jgi:hypothetical protein
MTDAIVTINGKTTVVTGWRARLMGFALGLLSVLMFAVIGLLMAGVAITAGAVMLIAIPVVIGAGLVASLYRALVDQPPRFAAVSSQISRVRTTGLAQLEQFGIGFSDFAGGGGSLIKGLGGVGVWFEGVVPTLGISFLSRK